MTNGTLDTVDGRPALRFVQEIGHPVERVWAAASEPAELAQWFPAAVAWTPSVGETLDAYGMTGEVTAVDAPHHLGWVFNGDVYGFVLEATTAGTRLTFVHVFDDRAAAAQTAAGWASYLARLEPLLNGEPITEEQAHLGWEERHEQYAAAFGVDPAPGREFAARLRSGE